MLRITKEYYTLEIIVILAEISDVPLITIDEIRFALQNTEKYHRHYQRLPQKINRTIYSVHMGEKPLKLQKTLFLFASTEVLNNSKF